MVKYNPFLDQQLRAVSTLFVDTTVSELESHLEEWPSVRDAEKKAFSAHLREADAAESSEEWRRAVGHYWECLRQLLKSGLEEWPHLWDSENEQFRTKSPHGTNELEEQRRRYVLGMKQEIIISREFRWWLVRRIHVRLAYILHFRLRLSGEAVLLSFTKLVFDCLHKDEVHADSFQLGVMNMAILLDSGTEGLERAKFLKSTIMSTIPGFWRATFRYLIVEYYRLGQIGDLWKWIENSKSMLDTDLDLGHEAAQELSEAIEFAKQEDFEKYEEIVLKLQLEMKERRTTTLEHSGKKATEAVSFTEAYLLLDQGEFEKCQEILTKLEHRGSSLEHNMPDHVRHYLEWSLQEVKCRLAIEIPDLKIQVDAEAHDESFCELNKNGEEIFHELACFHEAMKERWTLFRYKDIMRQLQSLIDKVKLNGDHHRVCLFVVTLAWIHIDLFYLKELRAFDSDSTTCSPISKEGPLRAILRVSDSSDGNQIESDGNNLHHLETALRLLDEAYSRAGHTKKQLGEMSTPLVDIVTDAGIAHFQIAEYNFRQFRETISPEVLIEADCHTMEQVNDLLELNGIWPEPSYVKAEDNLRQSLRLRRERLYSYMKSRNKSCIPMMEIDQVIYIALQWLAIRKINYKEFVWRLLRDASVQWLAALRMFDYKEFVSSLLQDASISAEKDATSGYIGPVQRLDEEFLLWSERGRASMLAFQLCRVNQQESEMEEIIEDFSAFDFDDKDAQNIIAESLDACGEGTIFLDYNFNTEALVSDLDDLNEAFVNRSDLDMWRGLVTYEDRNFPYAQKAFGVVQAWFKEKPGTNAKSVTVTLRGLQFYAALRRAQEYLGQAFNEELPYDESEVIKQLEIMFVVLIGPVFDFLEDIKSEQNLCKLVIICSNMISSSVPFYLLRNPLEPDTCKGYLFQSYIVSITPSLRSLKYNEERYSTLQNMRLMEGRGAILALGDPLYKGTSRRLPGTGAEVDLISNLFPSRCAAEKGQKASIETLLNWVELAAKKSSSQAFVHIGAHAGDQKYKHGCLKLTEPGAAPYTLPGTNCCESTADLASTSHSVEHRPDLGSSSHSLENTTGILSADDILDSQILWNAYMVVLSGCRSGLGEVKAEGVLSLARAFMAAGVPSLVVSQWKTEDESTAILMKLFYERLQEEMDVASALCSAMQHMKEARQEDGGQLYTIKQWGPFMAWGLPTVRLPIELVGKETSAALLAKGTQIVDTLDLVTERTMGVLPNELLAETRSRFTEALLHLKGSLDMMKAEKDHTDKSAIAQCLHYMARSEWWLGYSCHLAENSELNRNSRRHRAEKCRRFDSALRYLMETLEYYEALGSSRAVEIRMRVKYSYDLRRKWCHGEPKIPGLIELIKSTAGSKDINREVVMDDVKGKGVMKVDDENQIAILSSEESDDDEVDWKEMRKEIGSPSRRAPNFGSVAESPYRTLFREVGIEAVEVYDEALTIGTHEMPNKSLECELKNLGFPPRNVDGTEALQLRIRHDEDLRRAIELSLEQPCHEGDCKSINPGSPPGNVKSVEAVVLPADPDQSARVFEMLRKTKSAGFLESGKQILDAQKRIVFKAAGIPIGCPGLDLIDRALPAFFRSAKQHLDPKSLAKALLALKQSLDLMNADIDHTDKDAVVECLLSLAECEMNLALTCFLAETSVEVSVEQRRCFDSAIRYLVEAVEYSEDGGSSMARSNHLAQLNLQQAYFIRRMVCNSGELKVAGTIDIPEAIAGPGTHDGVDKKINDTETRFAEEHQADPYQESSPRPELGDLQELASIAHPTSPTDAERSACVSDVSCHEPVSECESKLPPSYADILAQVQDPPPSFSSKKEIYDFLCNRVRLQNGTREYWLDRETGGIWQSIGARGLTATWGDDARYWDWGRRRQGSRFSEIGYLKLVCWLEVKGRLQCSLHPGTYTLSWRLSYQSEHSWEHCIDPINFSLEVTGNEPVNTQCRLTANGPRVSAHSHDRGQQVLAWRLDPSGPWMEVDVGEFSIMSKDSPVEVNFSMRETENGNWKSGLYLDGVVICPSSRARSSSLTMAL